MFLNTSHSSHIINSFLSILCVSLIIYHLTEITILRVKEDHHQDIKILNYFSGLNYSYEKKQKNKTVFLEKEKTFQMAKNIIC